jgi:hypothetical protein
MQEQPMQEQPMQEQPMQEQPMQEQPMQEQPMQAAPAPQQPAAPMEAAPLAAAAHFGESETPPRPMAPQASIPMAAQQQQQMQPQQQMPIQPMPDMAGGVPAGFPQPASGATDALAKTQVHAPPQLGTEAPVPPSPGDGQHLRLVVQPPEHLPTQNAAPQMQQQQAPVAMAMQEAQAAPQTSKPTSAAALMQPATANVPAPQATSRSIPMANAGDLASTRLRPRSAVRTPRSGEHTAAFRTGVLVTLALAAGIVLGSMVFSIL